MEQRGADGKVREIPVRLPHPVMDGSDWADAYQVLIDTPFADARTAALAIIDAFPKWTNPLLALRQIVVLPLGLKGAGATHDTRDMISIFPVQMEMGDQIVAGFDDKHLDFRLVIDLASVGSKQRVTLTTVIKRHNWSGRAYLASIMPFHRAIIRGALSRLQRKTAAR